MAIAHISVQVISRSDGRSAVAAAAYRAAERIVDQRLGTVADYSRRKGLAHSEILTPKGAPEWMRDRGTLWNGVEAAEKRKDAQVAREVRVGLPRELSAKEQLKLLRSFVQTHFVDAGMVADIAVHTDSPNNPHAHIMLTTRCIKGDSFGPKERSWNSKDLLLGWREGWALEVNRGLERNGFENRIDTRSYVAQGIALEPLPNTEVGFKLGGDDGRSCMQTRKEEQADTVRRNGAAILANPEIALVGITHQRATFTQSELRRYLTTFTVDAAQREACVKAILASPELVRLKTLEHEPARLTTRSMLAAEQSMLASAEVLGARRTDHAVPFDAVVEATRGMAQEPGHAAAFALYSSDIAVIEGYAGAGKSTMLRHAKQAWEAAGFRVLGAALSGKAAEGLEISAGINARSLASWEYGWREGRDVLEAGDVFVVDEAGMVGTRQMQRVLAAVEAAGAKVVLVGDTQQLQAIEAGAPMRALATSVGHFAMVNIQRQRDAKDRIASVNLARGQVREALAHYTKGGAVLAHANQGSVVASMVRAWDAARQEMPEGSAIMLAYRRADVAALNTAARATRQAREELGASHTVQTTRGPRAFASGERVYFLRNDRGLGVKNGTLGTVTAIKGSSMQVQLDGSNPKVSGSMVAFDTATYSDLDYGYAATVHKAQGVTVDRAFVWATRHFDRHLSYVALTRHRDSVQMHYSREDFKTERALGAQMARAQVKDMATDYSVCLERIDVAPARQDKATELARERGTAVRDAPAAGVPHRTTQQHVQQVRPPHEVAKAAESATRDAALAAALAQGVSRSITAAQVRERVVAQAAQYAACQTRVRAHEALAGNIREGQHALTRAPLKTAEQVFARLPSVQAADRERASARDALARAQSRVAEQARTEAAYRETHPVRARLGMEIDRKGWAEARANHAERVTQATKRVADADQARQALERSPSIRGECERTVAAQYAERAATQRTLDKQVSELTRAAPRYAEDQRAMRGIEEAQRQREARMAAFSQTRHAQQTAAEKGRAAPLTAAAAWQTLPEARTALDAERQANRAYAQAKEAAQQWATHAARFRAEHPVKAALGRDDNIFAKAERAADHATETKVQWQRNATHVAQLRQRPDLLDQAEKLSATDKAGIEAERVRADKLNAQLEARAPQQRLDEFWTDTARDHERTLEPSRDRDRGLELSF